MEFQEPNSWQMCFLIYIFLMGIPMFPQAVAQVWGCFSCLNRSFPSSLSMGFQMMHPTPPTKALRDRV